MSLHTFEYCESTAWFIECAIPAGQKPNKVASSSVLIPGAWQRYCMKEVVSFKDAE